MTALENQARAVFLDVLDRPADEWPPILEVACGGNADLRARVEQLLQSHAVQGTIHPGGTSAMDDGQAHPGAVIGLYTLIEPIGEGGMGTVWMAQQTEPVKRRVALKFIKAGMDSKQVIARFEAERQALALMDHPNIARVIDGGTTGAGRPYFVMDLVKGVPITKYCDENHLTPRERLALFVPVCHAIQHAHQKGIIHRDVKPSNVLLAVCDGQPVPKVIDFGVAKAAGQSLTDKTLVTGVGNIVGTLEYMSPEQAEVNPLDVDTRSDIYSLGVLLYELLTGGPPFSKKDLEKAGMLEMLRVIREQEPTKPSAKLSTAEGLPTLAANRGTEPAKLPKLIRGELDWIVMKALEKDRTRRYETAAGFAADVQRYLADEPVQACPPTLGYRLRKFVRRHRGAVVTAVAFAALLAAGVAALGRSNWLLTRENQRRQEESNRARTNLRHALELLDRVYWQVVDKRYLRDPRLLSTDREMLEAALAATEAFARQSTDDPSMQRDIVRCYRWIGSVQALLGRQAEAEQAFAKATQLLEGLVDQFPNEPALREDLAMVLAAQAGSRQVTLGAAAAEPLFVRALQLADQVVAHPSSSDDARARLAAIELNYSQLLWSEQRRDEAEAHVRRALAILEQPRRSPSATNLVRSQWAEAQTSLGKMLAHAHLHAEAEAAYSQALDTLTELQRAAPFSADIRLQMAVTHEGRARLLRATGRSKEAEPGLRQGIGLVDGLVGEFPHVPLYRDNLAALHNTLADVLLDMNRTADAEQARRKTLALRERLATDEPENVARQSQLAAALNNVARLLGPRPEGAAEARQLLERAIPLQRTALKAEPNNETYRSFLINHCSNLAEVALRQDDHATASAAAVELTPLVTQPRDRLQTAMCFLRCLPLIEKDAKVSSTERARLANDHVNRAWELLKPTSIRGIVAASSIEKSEIFAPLRAREDFQKWLIEQKANEK